MGRFVLLGLCHLLALAQYTTGIPRPRDDLDHHRHRRQVFGGGGGFELDTGLSVLPDGPHPFDPDIRFPRPERPIEVHPPLRPDPCMCIAVHCPPPREIMLMPDPEFHRISRRAVDMHCLHRCCPTVPVCLTCRNGGTRFGSSCYCRTGYTGRCCETQETCFQPSIPAHGSLSPSKFVYVYGEVVTYNCDAGYRRNGDARTVCQLGNTWSGTTPACTAITCGSPGSLSNGRATPSGASHAYGTVVTFRCNTGYRLIGGATRTCQGVGAWTGSVPRCQIVSCSQLAAPANGNIQVSATTYGGVATYSCRDGFQLSGSRTRTCQADGNWSGAQPSCIVRRCPSITAPAHGVMLSSNVEAGSHVNFQCTAGYRLVGSQRITCRLDGTWSGQPPTCQVCPANQYKAGTNAITSCTNCPSNSHTPTTVNVARTSCVCNENYRGPNGGPCQLIQCSRLPAPPNAVINSCSTAYRGQCHFSCSPGHIYTSGDATRTCGVTGSWTGTAIVCTACEANTYTTDGRNCVRCPPHSYTQGLGTGPESCICETGFTKNTQQQCEDMNECTVDNGGCEQTCENIVGSYLCRCTDLGFVPDEEDFRRCVPANQCPALPAPANGGYVCVMQRRTNTQRCQLKCNRGYEHALSPNMFEECGPTTNWHWSYELIGDEIFPCREELFPGLVLDSEVFFFVRDCASLTPAELAAIMQEFLAYLVSVGLCTDTGVMGCTIVDVWVECHAEDTTPSGTGSQSLQRLGVNVRLAVSGVEMGDRCGQACESRLGCQQCAQEYSDSAREVLQSQAQQVATLFNRDFSHDMRLPSIIREADYHDVQIDNNFEMEQEFSSRLDTMATQYADRYSELERSDFLVEAVIPDTIIRYDALPYHVEFGQ